MEFIPTKRGGTKLIFNGREYQLRKTYVEGNKFWHCNHTKKSKGNLTLSPEYIVIKDNPHIPDCVSNLAKYIISRKMVQLKSKICENYDPIQKQFEAAICELKNDGLDMIAELPTYESVKSGMYNARNNVNDEIRILVFCSPDTESILQNFEVFTRWYFQILPATIQTNI